ncbi:DCC1-like thiol-disulfide oxidoreductase family protein [Streptomyces sp. DSM 42041]|uniref:DCC1-like thiol-disulfide oxidoreductase family protein n=1 Tax=Streptomyces hazeniae TaxID=3075538 RepID=A0ABU2NPU8_9ACTN|nr:DCC1-like thiol-disulfide oxidoreductase family protein [Streptomyces sp. DSM 42041]MDT0377658.1 DCC1-like thiol-disulfide oxidoreductase family protein [Streptomyces sp. DSM 42041]
MTAAATPAAPAAGDRDAARVPVRRLTVLYDAECGLCTYVRGWLARQRQLVPLELVPAGSARARDRFPYLDHATTLAEITVIGDGGQVYRGQSAWIVVLWALAEHRPTAHRLCTTVGAGLARSAVLAAAKWRGSQQTGNASGWSGGVYRRTDGWTYHPQKGWGHTGAVEGTAACADGTCGTD